MEYGPRAVEQEKEVLLEMIHSIQNSQDMRQISDVRAAGAWVGRRGQEGRGRRGQERGEARRTEGAGA